LSGRTDGRKGGFLPAAVRQKSTYTPFSYKTELQLRRLDGRASTLGVHCKRGEILLATHARRPLKAAASCGAGRRAGKKGDSRKKVSPKGLSESTAMVLTRQKKRVTSPKSKTHGGTPFLRRAQLTGQSLEHQRCLSDAAVKEKISPDLARATI